MSPRPIEELILIFNANSGLASALADSAKSGQRSKDWFSTTGADSLLQAQHPLLGLVLPEDPWEGCSAVSA